MVGELEADLLKMAKRMNVSLRYGSHLPVLIQAYRKTSGAILELGGGVFSTPILHWLCRLDNRMLLTYENYPEWFEFLKSYEERYHHLVLVDKWEDVEVDKSWDIAFVDLTPDDMRKEMVKKLVNNTRYVIVHDSNGRYNKIYHYETIYSLFKYKYTFSEVTPSTTVLSNFVDLENFI